MPRSNIPRRVFGEYKPEKDYPTRVILRFDDAVDIEYVPGAEQQFQGELREAWERLAKPYGGLTLQPLYDGAQTKALGDLIKRAQEYSHANISPKQYQYFFVYVPKGAEPATFAKELSAVPHVQSAYVESGPVEPPANRADDVLAWKQSYLGAARAAMNVEYAWSQGAEGAGVTMMDLEQGWALGHVDLPSGLAPLAGLNYDYWGHGTAVLGIIAGVDNTIGIIGIAPKATVKVISQIETPTNNNIAGAIVLAAAQLQAGDILLLEAQTVSNTMPGYLPVEVEDAIYDKINLATQAGIIIVEAAGNSANDLDNYHDAPGQPILQRGMIAQDEILGTRGDGYRNSGAIMVAAATSDNSHARWEQTNFGSRIDCYAWGESIFTTGNGRRGKSKTAYSPLNDLFGGTSGASAMIAAAAALVQSCYKTAHPVGHISPIQMRQLLKNPNCGTPSNNPTTDLIGVMPDLEKLFVNCL